MFGIDKNNLKVTVSIQANLLQRLLIESVSYFHISPVLRNANMKGSAIGDLLHYSIGDLTCYLYFLDLKGQTMQQ